MDVKKCTVCNIKIDKDNYKKDRNRCKNCYFMNRKKYNKNTFTRIVNNKKERKVVDSVNININQKKGTVVDFVNINKKTTASYHQPKIENVKNNKNRAIIIGFSNCGKTYLKNHILFQKHEPIFTINKSLNQYPSIKAQTSHEIQPLEHYENSTVVFDDILLSEQENKIDLVFKRGRHRNIDIYYISQRYFHLPKNNIRNNSNKIFFI